MRTGVRPSLRLAICGLVLGAIAGCGRSSTHQTGFETEPALGGSAGKGGGAGTGGRAGSGGGGSGGQMPAGAGGVAGETAGAAGSPETPTAVHHQVTGSWPERAVAIATEPGALTYTKVPVHDRFLAESCSIADYNQDGQPDISSGRRWYEGPFGPGLPIVEHIFRGGHDDLPRAGLAEEVATGVSDDWACYPFDMDGDGWTDIINIASPQVDETMTPSPAPAPQPHATAYWYRNPGPTAATEMWKPYLMHADVRGQQHGLADVDADGKPEIFGACRACEPAQRKGYYFGDWSDPTRQWSFRAVTTLVEFPFNGSGVLNGFGFGRVNDDATPDFLERSGIWTDPLAAEPNLDAFVPVQLYGGGDGGNLGGSHMHAFDVDGDGDGDIVAADFSRAYGMSWYEQTTPLTFVKRKFLGSPQESYGSVVFSSPEALEVADMDGDGVPDLITGKMRLTLPDGYGVPDLHGEPVNYVFRTLRDTPNAFNGGSVTFEAHPIDTSTTKVGVGRQIAVGHVNTDGVMDVCVASKLGLYVFLGN